MSPVAFPSSNISAPSHPVNADAENRASVKRLVEEMDVYFGRAESVKLLADIKA